MLRQIDTWLDQPMTKTEQEVVHWTGSTLKKPVVKIILAVASFGVFWFHEHSIVIATAFVVGIYLHELGHLWAMRSVGLSISGIWFIPFFGGVAVTSESSDLRWDRFLIAIMGPLTGFLSALIPFLVYKFVFQDQLHHLRWSQWYSDTPTEMPSVIIFTKCVLCVSALNLINLLPVPALDGGRMAKEMILSLGRWKARVSLVAVGGIAGFILWHVGSRWLIVLAALGILGVISDWKKKDDSVPMYGVEVCIGLVLQLILIGGLMFVSYEMYNEMEYWGGSFR
jgi:Zn-dependent protease